jgi:hypothetical protein
MKRQEVYNAWKEKKNRIDVREHFTDEVMNQLYQYEQKKRKPLFDYQQFIELISANLPAQAALIVAGAVAGLGRVIFMIAVILG